MLRLLQVCLLSLLLVGVVGGVQSIHDITDHSDTWVVIVGASRFWYNYR